MKKIVLIAGVLLSLMFIITATPKAQTPRIAIQLQHAVYPWEWSWGAVQLRFPLGSLTVSPTLGISDYDLSNAFMYVGVFASTKTQLLQFKTYYIYTATGFGFYPFYNGMDSVSVGIAGGIGWSPRPFLDVRISGGYTIFLNNSYIFPFTLMVTVQISWPLLK